MNTIAFATLLKTKTLSVYADFVPEKKTLPAVTYTHISDSITRVLKGDKSGCWDSWRVMIIGSNRDECKTLVETLRTIDNTSNNDFKNIFVVAEGNIPAKPEDKTRTAFMDIKTYG